MLIRDKIKLPTERIYSDEGFLTVPANISRTGIQVYQAAEMGLTDGDPTRIIYVYRPESEVFKKESLISFANKPVTNDHPPEAVNVTNFKKYTVGHSGPEVTQKGDFATTIIHVMDAETIALIETGKVELSNGYTADIEWTTGVTSEGQTYDAIQRNIKGNHIAIVERGRAGPDCSLADNLPLTQKNGDTMIKITIDGVDFEVSDQVAQAVNKLQRKVKDMEEEAEKKDEEEKEAEDEAEEAKKEAEKTADSLRAKLDDAKSKIPTPEQLDKLVADRVAFVNIVEKVAPDVKWQGKDNLSIMKEVLAANQPELQLDSKSNDYIQARFDLVVEDVESNPSKGLDNAINKSFTNDNKTQDNRSESQIARDRMIESNKNAWKGKAK